MPKAKSIQPVYHNNNDLCIRNLDTHQIYENKNGNYIKSDGKVNAGHHEKGQVEK